MKRRIFALLMLWLPATAAQSVWDNLDRALHYENASGSVAADLSVLADLEAYTIDQRPPAILVSDHDVLINPRLSVFVDAFFGRHFYGFVQARVDRGFDPGLAGEADARVDEYLLRFIPFDDGRLHIQAGKFATVVGNWVQRHDSWRNPFINAPLPYENMTTVSDLNPPPDAAGLIGRRDTDDPKFIWVPLIWGPSYATGIAAAGVIGEFDYALELKNAAMSSRPYVWDGFERDFDDPTVSTRLGWRPNAAWRLGASFSHGGYLRQDANLAPGVDRDDFDQGMLAFDLAWSHRHWEVWAELFLSRFEVPNAGDADTLAYYLEAKYRIDPHWFVAARWNQQLFDELPDGLGGGSDWDRDTWRIDSAVGYRFNRHWQARVQYSYTRKEGPLQQGEQTVSAQVTLKF